MKTPASFLTAAMISTSLSLLLCTLPSCDREPKKETDAEAAARKNTPGQGGAGTLAPPYGGGQVGAGGTPKEGPTPQTKDQNSPGTSRATPGDLPGKPVEGSK